MQNQNSTTHFLQL